MGMDLGGAQGGVKSDINVTPLVDVMLVLLIIMMLVAPLIQQGAAVRLPLAANTTPKPEVSGQTVLAITKDKTVYLNAKPVADADLLTKVKEALDAQTGEKIVLLKADTDTPYGAVMATMDQLRKANIEDMALIVDPKKGGQ